MVGEEQCRFTGHKEGCDSLRASEYTQGDAAIAARVCYILPESLGYPLTHTVMEGEFMNTSRMEGCVVNFHHLIMAVLAVSKRCNTTVLQWGRR